MLTASDYFLVLYVFVIGFQKDLLRWLLRDWDKADCLLVPQIFLLAFLAFFQTVGTSPGHREFCRDNQEYCATWASSHSPRGCVCQVLWTCVCLICLNIPCPGRISFTGCSHYLEDTGSTRRLRFSKWLKCQLCKCDCEINEHCYCDLVYKRT